MKYDGCFLFLVTQTLSPAEKKRSEAMSSTTRSSGGEGKTSISLNESSYVDAQLEIRYLRCPAP